ncbi:radical SAM protein [Vibrio owensii]|uniref:radical SAM protein n=1 Tax=Vibrio owensii TaxID=696485 RepID=UPI000A6EC608|nr:radical SAM protein [Vibrio owensii]
MIIKKIKCNDSFLSVNWALVNKCNYKCNYCHTDLNSGSIKTPPYDVAMKFVKKIIERSNSLKLTPYFEFGGGEVTILRYFNDLIKFIHHQNGMVFIVSNGSKPLKWWKDSAKYLDGVSLSYHINEVKDKSHFIDVAKVLESSKNTRLHINIMMVPHQFNDCYIFAQKLKEQVKCSIALQPLYDGFGHGGITKKYVYTNEQDSTMKKFRGRDDGKKLPQSRAFVNVDYLDGSSEMLSTYDLLINDKINFVGWDCYAGIESMVVTFSGDIYRAWCMQDGVIGSIYDEEITLPETPTRCRTKICQCGSDISSTKINRNIFAPLNQGVIIQKKI